MDSLIVKKHDDTYVVDSREVALMLEKDHKILMRDIRNYIEQMIGTDLYPSNFFIENEYIDDLNRKQPCYLLTKKGCEFVGNSMTGKKGTIFKATYINKFNEMEEQLKEEPKKLNETKLESLDTVNKSLELITPLLEANGIDNNSKLLVTKVFFEKAGVNIPVEVKTKEKYYTSEQIALELKVYSTNNKPHYHAVSSIISKLDVSEDETIVTLGGNGKSTWQGSVTKYTRSVIEKVLKWLIENEYPSKIEAKTKDKTGKEKTKNFHVVYKHEEVASC